MTTVNRSTINSTTVNSTTVNSTTGSATAVNCQLSFNSKLKIQNSKLPNNYQLSTVNCQLSTVNCQLSTMTSMDVLRQEAAAIGITETEAKKYGNIRHRRTWTLAIEHHLSMQALASKVDLPATPQQPDSPFFKRDRTAGMAVKSTDSKIELTANRCELISPAESQPAPPAATVVLPPKQIGKTGRYDEERAYRNSNNSGFQQVVQNHIKALKTVASSRTQLLNSQFSNWVCPECRTHPQSSCYLCGGETYVSDIEAIGWTLAYMELLGCSAKEIEPLRKLSPALDILEMNLKVCVAIAESSEVLARTEKWID